MRFQLRAVRQVHGVPGNVVDCGLVIVTARRVLFEGDAVSYVGADMPPAQGRLIYFASDQAAHDWILSIDADEALSEGLEGEIWNLKKNGPKYDAYTMPRLAQYLGRWILHCGWYPDRKRAASARPTNT